MITWFKSREPREQVLLGILGALVLFLAAWYGLSREGGPKAETVLADAQADRELWLRAAPRLSSGSDGATVRTEFSRGALIDLARRRNLPLTRVQPQNDGSLTVWVDDVAAPPLFGLMEALTAGYAVDLKSVLVSRTPQGSLNAQFTLMPLG